MSVYKRKSNSNFLTVDSGETLHLFGDRIWLWTFSNDFFLNKASGTSSLTTGDGGDSRRNFQYINSTIFSNENFIQLSINVGFIVHKLGTWQTSIKAKKTPLSRRVVWINKCRGNTEAQATSHLRSRPKIKMILWLIYKSNSLDLFRISDINVIFWIESWWNWNLINYYLTPTQPRPLTLPWLSHVIRTPRTSRPGRVWAACRLGTPRTPWSSAVRSEAEEEIRGIHFSDTMKNYNWIWYKYVDNRTIL